MNFKNKKKKLFFVTFKQIFFLYISVYVYEFKHSFLGTHIDDDDDDCLENKK